MTAMTVEDLESLGTELLEQSAIARMRSGDARRAFSGSGAGLMDAIEAVYAAAREMNRAAGELRNVAHDSVTVSKFREP